MQLEFAAAFRQVPEGYLGFVEELAGANTQGAMLAEARESLAKAAAQLVIEANRALSTAEGLAQGGAVIGRPAGPAHEGAVGPETAVGDDEMEMGMPVGQRAVGLETGDDADPEVGLPRGGADACGDDAGRQPRQVAEEGPAVAAVGAEPRAPKGPAGESLGVAAFRSMAIYSHALRCAVPVCSGSPWLEVAANSTRAGAVSHDCCSVSHGHDPKMTIRNATPHSIASSVDRLAPFARPARCRTP